MKPLATRTGRGPLAMLLLSGSLAIAAPNDPSVDRPLPSNAAPAKVRSRPADERTRKPSMPPSAGAPKPRSLPANNGMNAPLQWDRLEPSVIERNTKRVRVEKPAFRAEQP